MIFLDSSLIVAYANAADSNHVVATHLVAEIDRGTYGTGVTTDYVFDEVVTVILARTKRLQQAAEVGEKLLHASQLIHIDEELFQRAWQLFKAQRGGRFSFTDCTSSQPAASTASQTSPHSTRTSARFRGSESSRGERLIPIPSRIGRGLHRTHS